MTRYEGLDRIRIDINLLCRTAALCNNARINVRIGTNNNNACLQPICTNDGCQPLPPAAATALLDQFAIVYNLRIRRAFPPSLCLTETTTGRQVLLTTPVNL